MKIDLHNHTRYSDGVYSCEELVVAAKKNHVDIFALTDHDAVAGCDEMKDLSIKYGIKILYGMELSTEYHNQSVHIVCLFKGNRIPQEAYEYERNMIANRQNRAIQMMNNISSIYGLKINIDKLLKESIVITRANMLRNIAVENQLSLEEASFYVNKDSKAYIPSTHLPTKEGIAFAKKLGCITILAHPCLIREEDVESIIQLGVDGIEARYPMNKEGQEISFTALANKYGLFISAGSDCHGDKTHAAIGTCTLNEEEFKVIEERLELL